MDNDRQTRIILLTGVGKGKTTAALGMALRAVGHGLRVCVIQFIKQSAETGEARALRLLPDIEHHLCGRGFVRSAETEDVRGRHCAAATDGLARARERLSDVQTEMVILDEICGAIALGLLPVQPVLDCLRAAADGKIIVLTGRDAPQALIDLADTVSHIHSVKHGFNAHLPARAGVEF